MGLSEDEIAARLAELRRRREALDREIADHLLYLELGRRLRAGGADAGPPTGAAEPVPAADPDPAGVGPDEPRRSPPPWPSAPQPQSRPARTAPPQEFHPPDPEAATGLPDQVPFGQDPAGARRYGRALVAGALAVLAEGGRPMHAGELLERLVARGFSVPGRDPVAALNTRLWKRAGPGGPLRRLGDAVYDRADAPAAPGGAVEPGA